ncbi:hypothetical protein VSS74_26090 [Conexibacter stalactiti]|uniref:Uncharacterized protein n=1 Tax=Conexibacter stalactiti TaxID=1940611 RepID=A0ABU4HX31_9ACTN|nr:hypothetical protein [Conexibacter stalactiti]MDW5597851.1 hypothetical protein [Conexibacter stalactiti]MEC5038493.1 hypothetical protein [Conexibacter stalactiti]
MQPKATILRLLVLGGCATAVTTAALTTTAPADPKPERSPALAAPAPRVGPVPGFTSAQWRSLAREQLEVLEEPREAAADAVPASIRSQPLFADGAVELAAAREVAPGAERAWIAPSADGTAVCAFRTGAVACPSVARLTVTGLAPGVNGRYGEPFHVWGIAGDDTSSIVLIEADGTRVAVTVTDNFFDVETDDWPRGMTWTGPEGAESFEFPADGAW